MYEVYKGTVKGDADPCRTYDSRRLAENFADEIAMGGQPASVYEVRDDGRFRVYAVSL